MKRIICIVLAATAFLMGNPAPGLTQSGHRGGGTPSSGGHSSGGSSHGGYSHGGYSHGGYYHGSHGHYSGSIWIGSGWGYGGWGYGGWGPAYPYYYPYSYPYYAAPPVVIQQSPTQYIQRDQETDVQDYWYFCRKPEGYYPYVNRCPSGWLRVIPSDEPPDLRK
jgi:hypothetical protein